MAAVCITIPGEPVSFARAGSNGKRRFTPKKQADYMTAARHFAARAMEGRAPIEGPVEMEVEAVFLVPDSWSKTKRAAAVWKASKPDASNLVKIVEDAFNGIVYRDDAQIARSLVVKRYGVAASINLIVRPL